MTVLIYLQNSYVGPRADDNSMLDERAFPPPEAQIYIYFFFASLGTLLFCSICESVALCTSILCTVEAFFLHTRHFCGALSLQSRIGERIKKQIQSAIQSPLRNRETEKPSSTRSPFGKRLNSRSVLVPPQKFGGLSRTYSRATHVNRRCQPCPALRDTRTNRYTDTRLYVPIRMLVNTETLPRISCIALFSYYFFCCLVTLRHFAIRRQRVHFDPSQKKKPKKTAVKYSENRSKHTIMPVKMLADLGPVKTWPDYVRKCESNYG